MGDYLLPPTPRLVRWRFKIGDRVLGVDAGEIVALEGPYSVVIRRDRDGVCIVSCALDLVPAPKQNEAAES